MIDSRRVRYYGHSASARETNAYPVSGSTSAQNLQSAWLKVQNFSISSCKHYIRQYMFDRRMRDKSKRNDDYPPRRHHDRYPQARHDPKSVLKILYGLIFFILLFGCSMWYFTGNGMIYTFDANDSDSVFSRTVKEEKSPKRKGPNEKKREKRKQRAERWKLKSRMDQIVEADSKVIDAEKALNELLKLKEYTPQRMKVRIPRSANAFTSTLDQTLSSLINNHCVETLPFDLEHSSKTTLMVHLQSFIELIYERQRVPQFSMSKAVVTGSGTIIEGRKESVDITCPLLTALIKRSIELELVDVDMINVYGLSEDTVWNEREGDTHYSALDAVSMIKMVRHHGLNGLHRAQMLIPNMLNLHCPQIQDIVGGITSFGMMETIRSVNSILERIHIDGQFVIGFGEIPVIDHKGFLVAIDAMKFEEKTSKQTGRYSACTLIDELVFYSNTDLQGQVADALNAVKGNLNLLAFETKMDVLMEEHCHDVVAKLSGKTMEKHRGHRRRGNVYDEVFESELVKFAKDIVGGANLEGNQFVITEDGGIMHQSVVKKNGMRCRVIDEMVKHIDDGSKKKPIDEHRFDPEIKDEVFEDEMDLIEDRIESKEDAIGAEKPWRGNTEASIEQDAGLLFKYAENPSQFRRALEALLYLHHGADLSALPKAQISRIRHEVEGVIMKEMHRDGDEAKWSDDFVIYIDNVAARIFSNPGDVQQDAVHLVRSPLLTRLFQRVAGRGNAGEEMEPSSDIVVNKEDATMMEEEL